MLDLSPATETHAVRELSLSQRLFEQPMLTLSVQVSGLFHFTEDVEFHCPFFQVAPLLKMAMFR